MPLERSAKRLLAPVSSPATKRRIIAARDRGVGAIATVRHRLGAQGQAPSLVIAGAQKAGTTFLHSQIERHPDVRSPLTKELHFFDDRHAQGLDWYLGHFPSGRDDASVTIESSPGYVYHPHAIGRMANDLPDVRVIVLVRDPVHRAYSHFLHERRLGFEPEANFERALELESERVAPDLARLADDPTHVGFAWRHFSYVSRGEYLPQIERCERILGSDRLLVVRSEDMFADPAAAVASVVHFADLAAWDPGRLAPNDMAAVGDEPLDPVVEARLRERFAEPNAELARHLGRDLAW